MIDLKPIGCYITGGLIWFSPFISRILRICVPFLLVICLIAILFTLYDNSSALELGGLLLLYFVPPAGKESIIPAAIALGFPFEVVCLSIVLVDIACCLFMIWNFELVCSIPYLGTLIQYLMKKGETQIRKHQWLERLYVVGLALFVFFPLQGTGSVSGSIIGKMLGLKSVEIFGSITIGSLLSSFLIGFSVYALNEYFDVNAWYIFGAVIILLIIIPVISFLLYRHRTRRRG
ncbi:MAG: small multi-drug export protein [Methanomicrobiales archaeon]|nr:small multi-drug export protein [Methanomicrobiales archaeon]